MLLTGGALLAAGKRSEEVHVGVHDDARLFIPDLVHHEAELSHWGSGRDHHSPMEARVCKVS